MGTKRKAAAIVVVIATISIFVIYVSAHPGRTDSSGGHYNRSTGEYHYHHGYSEHQHTGGVCPYEFDDKTDRNSGVNSHAGNQEKGAESQNMKETEQESPSESGSPKTLIYDLVGWFLAVSLVLPFIVAFCLGSGYKIGEYNQKIKMRNKRFLSISVFSSVFLLFVLCLINSDFTGKIEFARATNGNTGEHLSILASIVVYGFLYWLFSMLIASFFAFYSLLLYGVLHRKDGGISTSRSSLPHENECHYIALVSMGLVFVAGAIVVLLHAFGIIIFRI